MNAFIFTFYPSKNAMQKIITFLNNHVTLNLGVTIADNSAVSKYENI